MAISEQLLSAPATSPVTKYRQQSYLRASCNADFTALGAYLRIGRSTRLTPRYKNYLRASNLMADSR